MEHLKICGVIISYGRVPFIKDVIASMEDLPIYVINPFRSWWSEEMKDYTKKKISGCDVRLVQKYLESQADALNFARRYMREEGYDVMVILDTDEVLEGLDELIDFIHKKESDSYTCGTIDYGPDFKPLRPREHQPIVAVKTGNPEYKFYDKRCFNGLQLEKCPNSVKIHHYSLCNPEEFKYKHTRGYGEVFPPIEYREVINED